MPMVLNNKLIQIILLNITATIYLDEDLAAAYAAAKDDLQTRDAPLQIRKLDDTIPPGKQPPKVKKTTLIAISPCVPQIGCGTFIKMIKYDYTDGTSNTAISEKPCCCRKGLGKIIYIYIYLYIFICMHVCVCPFSFKTNIYFVKFLTNHDMYICHHLIQYVVPVYLFFPI